MIHGNTSSVPDLGQDPQDSGPWAQLINGASGIKKLDEVHVAISFLKPRKFALKFVLVKIFTQLCRKPYKHF